MTLKARLPTSAFSKNSHVWVDLSPLGWDRVKTMMWIKKLQSLKIWQLAFLNIETFESQANWWRKVRKGPKWTDLNVLRKRKKLSSLELTHLAYFHQSLWQRCVYIKNHEQVQSAIAWIWLLKCMWTLSGLSIGGIEMIKIKKYI